MSGSHVPPGPTLLALDAATERCSVALRVGGRIVSRAADAGRATTPELLHMVRGLLAEAGLRLAALDAIAASVGPGAFTGVRVSVAVAQGLAFGAGLPVVPITTLESLAFGAIRAGGRRTAPVLACLDARMGELYWGCFRPDPRRGVAALGPARVGPPASVTFGEAGDGVLSGGWQGIGKGFSAYPSLAFRLGLGVADVQATRLPDAGDAALLGSLRLAAGEGIDPAELSPVYLRDKVALTEAERRAK